MYIKQQLFSKADVANLKGYFTICKKQSSNCSAISDGLDDFRCGKHFSLA